MESERCLAMLEAVIDGFVEILTTTRDLVVGSTPKVRKEVAIYKASVQSSKIKSTTQRQSRSILIFLEMTKVARIRSSATESLHLFDHAYIINIRMIGIAGSIGGEHK